MTSEKWNDSDVTKRLEAEATAAKVWQVLGQFTEGELEYLDEVIEHFTPTTKDDWAEIFNRDIAASVDDRFYPNQNVDIAKCYKAFEAMSDEDYELIMNNKWPLYR